MSKPNSLAVQFPQLNQEIPEKLTLPQWQYLYSEVIFSMGMRILELFPQDALGPNPFGAAGVLGSGRPSGGHAGGPPPPPPPPPFGPREAGGAHGPGYQPSLSVATAALSLTPTPTPTGKVP
jgi:hypothetical protein